VSLRTTHPELLGAHEDAATLAREVESELTRRRDFHRQALATDRLQHDGAGTTPTEQTRTIHQPVATWLLQGLGYHREHHLDPRIPALKLRAFVRDRGYGSQQSAVSRIF
jgi:fatty acid desaturase